MIEYIGRREIIESLYVSTFRIGQKQMQVLDNLRKNGQLKEAVFLTSDLNSKDAEQYNYFELCKKVCECNGWDLISINNHSKIILMRTEQNYYVIETSSNLNENPKLEQYNFENDKGTYEFYKGFFEACKNMNHK